MVDAPEPNDEQAALLAGGMEILVGVLGTVLSGLGAEADGEREGLGTSAVDPSDYN
jgi:hypothetical protein